MLWGAIICLLLMNISLMGLLWWSPQQHPGRPQEPFFLEKELSFDEHQKEIYRELRKGFFASKKMLHDSIKEKKENFLKQVTSKLTDEELLTASSAIEANAVKMNILTYKHLHQVYEMCTPEQRRKFDGIIDRIAFQMAKPQEPPRRGGEHRPPGDIPRGDGPPDDMPPPR